jgi:hypothetical protein
MHPVEFFAQKSPALQEQLSVHRGADPKASRMYVLQAGPIRIMDEASRARLRIYCHRPRITPIRGKATAW